MRGTGADHYSTLRLERTATPAEVKRAYFRLVKVHTPEDDPAQFRAISEAYRVLSDPEARQAYDADEQLPPGAGEALGAAWSCCEKEPDRAFAMAKDLLAVHGASPLVRCAVAGLLMNCGHAAEAVPIYAELVREFPARADYAANLGTAYLRADQREFARRAFEVAVVLDPKRRATYMEMASLAERAESTEDVLQTLERGVRAGGGPDLGALPLQLRRLSILARDGRWDEMTRVADEVRASVPAGDADAARHVASNLFGMAEQYVEAAVHDVGKFLVDAAFSVDPHPALKERSDQLGELAAAARACRVAHRDGRVAGWIRTLLPQHYGVRMGETAWQANWQSIVARIRRSPWWADRQWKKFATLHPAAAGPVADHWKALRQQALVERSARKANTSTAGVAWVILLLILSVTRMVSCSNRDRRPEPSRFDPTRVATRYAPPEPRLTQEEMDEYWESLTPAEREKLLGDDRRILELILPELRSRWAKAENPKENDPK